MQAEKEKKHRKKKASKRKVKSKHWETLKLGRGARNPVKNIGIDESVLKYVF